MSGAWGNLLGGWLTFFAQPAAPLGPNEGAEPSEPVPREPDGPLEEADGSPEDSSEPPGQGTDGGLRPPELETYVEPIYPVDAPEGARGRVVLELTIDVEGAVQAAEVVETADEAFVAAAIEAATQLRFVPARRGGTPVAAQILYALDFEPPAAAEPPTPEQGLTSVRGRILLPGDAGQPVAGAEVRLVDAEGTSVSTRTDGEGRFAFDGLAPGSYHVEARAEGIGRLDVPIALAPNQPSELALRLLPATQAEVVTVHVRGPSEAERLRESARAVTVVETATAKRQTVDLGEVLARTQGVSVRRSGGLGSVARFSLNGLTDDQIRFFVDGIPMEMAGFVMGIADVPVLLVDRVEIYRGVVPTRFGSDALGGAVNLVTDTATEGTHGFASYQAGSFGMHRVATGASHLDPKRGFVVRGSGFFDHADNDYPVDVDVPDETGRLSPARVHRFHDRYRAGGGTVEAGFVDRPWAKRLLLRSFVTGYDKEMQHNLVMSVPYGAVEYGGFGTGALLRYEQTWLDRITFDVIAGYAYRRTWFTDVGECVYDWFGRCVRERRQPGEIENRPTDQEIWDHSAYGRGNLAWEVRRGHGLLLSVSPTFTSRSGDERRQINPMARDPLSARRNLFSMVTGLEYDLRLLRERIQNIAFLKDYVQVLDSEEPLPGGVFRERDRTTHRFGVGDSLRIRILEWMYAKLSYEWATRLPRPDEVFGDGIRVVANLELEPESSHNGNLGWTIDARETIAGAWRLDVNGFLRQAKQLIVMLGNERVFSYQNVYGARSLGIEATAGWTSPRDYVALDGNVTYQSFRNTSSEGTFGANEGDRIPNRPYLFANGAARLQFSRVASRHDQISLAWHTRYVHAFFRGWESLGLREFKAVVDAQLLHSIAVTYRTRGGPVQLSFTAELLNLTDAKAYDFFGVQRPGRSTNFNLTAEF